MNSCCFWGVNKLWKKTPKAENLSDTSVFSQKIDILHVFIACVALRIGQLSCHLKTKCVFQFKILFRLMFWTVECFRKMVSSAEIKRKLSCLAKMHLFFSEFTKQLSHRVPERALKPSDKNLLISAQSHSLGKFQLKPKEFLVDYLSLSEEGLFQKSTFRQLLCSVHFRFDLNYSKLLLRQFNHRVSFSNRSWYKTVLLNWKLFQLLKILNSFSWRSIALQANLIPRSAWNALNLRRLLEAQVPRSLCLRVSLLFHLRQARSRICSLVALPMSRIWAGPAAAD